MPRYTARQKDIDERVVRARVTPDLPNWTFVLGAGVPCATRSFLWFPSYHVPGEPELGVHASATPTPETHAILAVLKAGGTVYLMYRVNRTRLGNG